MTAYTIEEARRTVAGWSSGTPEWQEAIAERIARTGEPLYHAAAVLRLRFMETEAPRCVLCGEPSDAAYLALGNGAHLLCKARAERGRPTPPLPYYQPCGCVRCGEVVVPEIWNDDTIREVVR